MKPENIRCPECTGPMLRRTNKATGQAFWGCANFPKCRGSRNTDGESRAEQKERRHQTGVSSSLAHEPHDEPGLPSERARRNDKGRW